jgi:hypothetical protein
LTYRESQLRTTIDPHTARGVANWKDCRSEIPEVLEPSGDSPGDVTQEFAAPPTFFVDYDFRAGGLPDTIGIESVTEPCRQDVVVRKNRQPWVTEILVLVGICDAAHPIEASVAFGTVNFTQRGNLVPRVVDADAQLTLCSIC